MRVALALTLVCTAVAIYAVVKYTSAEHDTRVANEKVLQNAYGYFDTNRKLLGIQSLAWVQKATSGVTVCPTGYMEEPLFNWPGSKQGYQDTNAKYVVGTSTT